MRKMHHSSFRCSAGASKAHGGGKRVRRLTPAGPSMGGASTASLEHVRALAAAGRTQQIAISRSLRSGAGQSSHGRENVKSNVASDALRARLTSIEAFPRDRNAVFERPSARRLA